MASQISTIIDPCSKEYRDASKVTITAPEWLELYNRAVRALIAVRPDVNIVRKDLTLAAGSSQALTGSDARLVRLLCNTDGVTLGAAITGPVGLEEMDAANRNWRAATQSGTIEEYMWSDVAPASFDVNPPATVGTLVHAAVQSLPADATGSTDNIPDGILAYSEALAKFMLHLAFARDDERSPNWEKSGRNAALFFNLLGVKARSDLVISPPRAEQIAQPDTRQVTFK